MAGSGDLVAIWEIKLSDGVHNIEFEHGTTSGKRVVRVNGKVTSIHESHVNLTCYESCLLGIVCLTVLFYMILVKHVDRQCGVKHMKLSTPCIQP